MDERVALTRAVAQRMLVTKPWPLLLRTSDAAERTGHIGICTIQLHPSFLSTPSHSPSAAHAVLCLPSVTVSRLHNLLVLFPDLLSLPKCRDVAFTAVSTLAASHTASCLANSTRHFFYQDALLDLLLSLSSSFTPSQRSTLTSFTRTFEYSAASRAALVGVRQRFIEQDPFVHLRLSSHHLTFPSFEHQRAAVTGKPSPAHLVEGSGKEVRLPLAHLPRLTCPECHRLQPFYCTHCYCVVHPLAGPAVPRIHLPFHLHIILHPAFDRTKSTALHARLLCKPGDVTVHISPHLPPLPPLTFLLFPSPTSVPLCTFAAKFPSFSPPPCPPTPPTHVVLLEGTWPQAQAMADHPRMRDLPHVRLRSAVTAFWRYQGGGGEYLSSVEAVRALAREWVRVEAGERAAGLGEEEGGGSDDLLWLFALGFKRMQDYYTTQPQLLPPLLHCDASAEATE